MLPCDKVRCIKYLTVEEIIQELSDRKAFQGIVLRTNDGKFNLTHTLDKETLIKALKKAIEILEQ